MSSAGLQTTMTGKLCVVTGGTSGIGRATALELGRAGADVIVIGRNTHRGENVVQLLKRETNHALAVFMRCDLSSLGQVRELAGKIVALNRPIDVLINNAGAKFDRFEESDDGVEMTFAANHLGHFLLTALLYERLAAAPTARIINVAGQSHWSADDKFEQGLNRGHFDRRMAACRAKLANLLFTYELARRLHGKSITVNAVHPGGVATRVNLNNGIWPWLRHIGSHLLSRNLISPRRGADTIVFLATSPEDQITTGQYWYLRKLLASSPLAQDVGTARKLWQLSMRLTQLDEKIGASWAVFRD
jgi:retinol dehydrogenase 14